MEWKNTSTLWGGVTQLFHWGGMLCLFIVQYTLAYTMVGMPASNQKWALFDWHKQIGLTLLILVFLRLWWREVNIIPKNFEESPQWDRFLSKSNIWILYILMFSFPLTGGLLSVLGGHPVSYFGLFTIPAFIEGPDVYAKVFLTAHIWISYALYAFVGLYHYFCVKDKVLQSMFPHT